MQMGITQSLWLSRCIMHHPSQFSSGSKPLTRESCMLALMLCMSQCASAMYTWPAELFHSTLGCVLTVQSGQLAVPCFSSKAFLLLESNTDGSAGPRESMPPSSLGHTCIRLCRYCIQVDGPHHISATEAFPSKKGVADRSAGLDGGLPEPLGPSTFVGKRKVPWAGETALHYSLSHSWCVVIMSNTRVVQDCCSN